MSKIFKLFINENIKTWKKFSTKLSIILIIISLIGTLSLVKIIQKYEETRPLPEIPLPLHRLLYIMGRCLAV